MRDECVRAGLKGLYLVACVADAAQAREAAAAGFDGVTGYTWPHLGVPAGEFRAPFASILEGYRRNWQHILDTAGIPLLPPVCGGWDSRPWHGENNFIRFDRTPELFRQHLRDARQLLESRPNDARLRNLLIVEAWNEWGEGAYIEPHREFGFGYLDAIREALTDERDKHTDAAPIDIGRGPLRRGDHRRQPDGVGVRRRRRQLAWPDECLRPESDERRVDVPHHGARPRDRQSAPRGPRRGISQGAFPHAPDQRERRVRHRITGQIYWSTEHIPESAATGASFAAVADGQWHEYEVDVAKNPRWRGRITRLRFDPCEQSDLKVELDWLRLCP